MENEFINISDQTFHKLTNFFFQLTGISIKEYKKYLVLHRLSKFIGPGKPYPNFESYYQALVSDKSGNMVNDFINVLTTNFSFFFRESIHFDFLRKYLEQNQDKQEYLRIWSAASSTGEEAYSIAICALETIPQIQKKDFKILASDISTKVLNIAIKGQYQASKINGYVPKESIRKYFYYDKKNQTYIVKEELKNLIAFRYLNLLEPYPFKKQFDIVFLRNVLIYFDNQEKKKIIDKIVEYIKPNGYLILGLSESLVGIALNHPIKNLKNSIYQKIA